MTPRLYGQNYKFFTTSEQFPEETSAPNQTNHRYVTRETRSHVRILIYRKWAIKEGMFEFTRRLVSFPVLIWIQNLKTRVNVRSLLFKKILWYYHTNYRPPMVLCMRLFGSLFLVLSLSSFSISKVFSPSFLEGVSLLH